MNLTAADKGIGDMTQGVKLYIQWLLRYLQYPPPWLTCHVLVLLPCVLVLVFREFMTDQLQCPGLGLTLVARLVPTGAMRITTQKNVW